MKKWVQGGLDPLLGVDLSFLQTAAQVLGGDIDVDELIGLRDDAVGDTLPDLDPRGSFDRFIQTFQVLDVQSGDDVDTRGEHLFHILIAFGVLASRDVGVGEFVDEHDARAAGKNGVEIHFLDLYSAVGDPFAAGNHFEPVKQRLGFRPPVCFNKPDGRRRYHPP